ncbi:MAG: DUF1080 domain-containing protein [Phycisphaerales bacterium]|jgi:hypothetical protein|nr:DUF1080 domain-containing protein [Phycisphaerales bacterium]
MTLLGLAAVMIAGPAEMQPGAVMRVWQLDQRLAALAPLVPGQDPNVWLRVDAIDLSDERGDFGPLKDDFLALIDGELLVKRGGVHEFRLTSDDGSQLWIGGHRVVDNDGRHSAQARVGEVDLPAGAHPFQVKFFEGTVSCRLVLEWRPPGAESFELVPREAMRSHWPTTRPVTAGPKAAAPRLTEKHDVGPEPAGPHNTLTDAQREAGWRLLFDGAQADPWWRGFKQTELPEGWVVEGGMLIRAGSGGDIVTRDQFDDFDLYVDWMVQPRGNSGIFFNGSEEGNAIWETAPEMQVLDNIGHGDGVTALQSAGANYALHAPQVDASRVAGKWNRARICVQGDHVQYWLNGIKTADYVIGSDDWKRRVAGSKFIHMPAYGTKASGHIGLQDHGDRVAFRNIRIRTPDGTGAK